MKHTNAPPVYLLCYGQFGQLTETVMPARVRQLLHIIQFPEEANDQKRSANTSKPTGFLTAKAYLKKRIEKTTQTETLMNRLLFSRQTPLVIFVLDPSKQKEVEKAERMLRLLTRAGIKALGLFLDVGFESLADLPNTLARNLLGYTRIRLEGHANDAQTYRRAAQSGVRKIELLHHLAAYPDSQPSFLRMLPLLLKESPQFVLAAGFADENLSVAGKLLNSKLNERLQKPVRGRSLVMVLSIKRHLGFHEVSIIHGTCATLLGQRMLVTSGGRQHPLLRMGQYMVIGMVNEGRG